MTLEDTADVSTSEHAPAVGAVETKAEVVDSRDFLQRALDSPEVLERMPPTQHALVVKYSKIAVRRSYICFFLCFMCFVFAVEHKFV